MKRISTNPAEYVVFDVETNGLSSKLDDLLSISFYKPDDGKEYNKLLPLELSKKVYTTKINGITKKDLVGATPLTQLEFNHLVEEFELEKRTILIYAGKNFDAMFLSEYMRRHKLLGFDNLTFYNFKKRIISSSYSTGNLTKDNLCTLFKISEVKTVHSSLNDCKLEWQLFKKMDGYCYLVTEGTGEDNVFRLNEDYIIPASLLYSHPNLSRTLPERPYIECQTTLVKTFEIDAKGVEKFPTNITEMTIEHLIDTMLNVQEQDSRKFLLDNKKKLRFIGKIPNGIEVIPMIFNSDGTITACNNEDKQMAKRINATLKNLKGKIQPLINYIKHEIFKDEPILSHELVVDHDNNFLALCDLSNDRSILEIKTTNADSQTYKEQLFYEARGRTIYHLRIEWQEVETTKKLFFRFFLVDAHIETPPLPNWTEGKQQTKRMQRILEIQKYLLPLNASLVSYTNTGTPIKVKCNTCGYEWNTRFNTIQKNKLKCPICTHNNTQKERTKLSNEEQLKLRADKFKEKILQKSNQTIVVADYTSSREVVHAQCTICGYIWKPRADHLLERCWCPKCKKKS